MMVLMEGVYLHNLMFLNLFSDNTRITAYYLLGWGLPLVFLLPWVILRVHFEDEYCWTNSRTYLSLLIDLPIALTVIVSVYRAVTLINQLFQINFVLFITFTRVLCIKLNSMYVQQRSIKYRKLTKSTLILVPLFGVPYVISLILSLQAKTNDVADLVYLFFDQTFTSFQVDFLSPASVSQNLILGILCCHYLLSYKRGGAKGSNEEVSLLEDEEKGFQEKQNDLLQHAKYFNSPF